MADAGVEGLLRSWMSPERLPLGEVAWARELIGRVGDGDAPKGWHETILARSVNRALIHGDFAVWNTRKSADGLCALDWEWAEENGVAGVDLAHGLRQEGYMVHRMPPVRAVEWMLSQARAHPWRLYLDDCGWGDAPEDWLRLGLLHSHFNARNGSTELLDVLGIHLKC
jgi:thiamine kinase-like enzyme